jgi:hypothetical protein
LPETRPRGGRSAIRQPEKKQLRPYTSKVRSFSIFWHWRAFAKTTDFAHRMVRYKTMLAEQRGYVLVLPGDWISGHIAVCELINS